MEQKPIFMAVFSSGCGHCTSFMRSQLQSLKTKLQEEFQDKLFWYIIIDNQITNLECPQLSDTKKENILVKYVQYVPSFIFFPVYAWGQIPSDQPLSSVQMYEGTHTAEDIIGWIKQCLMSKGGNIIKQQFYMYY